MSFRKQVVINETPAESLVKFLLANYSEEDVDNTFQAARDAKIKLVLAGEGGVDTINAAWELSQSQLASKSQYLEARRQEKADPNFAGVLYDFETNTMTYGRPENVLDNEIKKADLQAKALAAVCLELGWANKAPEVKPAEVKSKGWFW